MSQVADYLLGRKKLRVSTRSVKVSQKVSRFFDAYMPQKADQVAFVETAIKHYWEASKVIVNDDGRIANITELPFVDETAESIALAKAIAQLEAELDS